MDFYNGLIKIEGTELLVSFNELEAIAEAMHEAMQYGLNNF